MARMQRATIEEAATYLGVTQRVVEMQIKSGSLVPCQDPSFRRCVWISEAIGPKPKRKARAAPKKDALNHHLDLPGRPDPAEEIGLLQKTVDLLNTDLEISAPKIRRKAKDTPKKDPRGHGIDPVGSGKPSEETGLLQETIARLQAGLEIRDERLDLLGGKLELLDQEVQNLRLLLDRIQLSEQAQNTDLYQPPPPLPAAIAMADRPGGHETPGTVAEPPDPVGSTLAARPGYFRKIAGSFRPFFGQMYLGFSLPLFH